MTNTIRTVGLVRFSVLAQNYYLERFASTEEVAEHLFSDARMALRFRLFENICLRSLTRQSDPDFQLVILTSALMPERHLQRLADLTDGLDNVHVFPAEIGNHYRLTQDGYDLIPHDGASHRCMFRLDDDDGLDGGFVARLKKLASGLLTVQEGEQPFVIAFNRGFYLDGSADAGSQVFDACERMPLSTGTAIVAPVGRRVNPYRFNHRKYPQHFNTYTDISVPTFLRTLHGDNKSNPAQIGLTHKMTDEEIQSELLEHFDWDIADLKALL